VKAPWVCLGQEYFADRTFLTADSTKEKKVTANGCTHVKVTLKYLKTIMASERRSNVSDAGTRKRKNPNQEIVDI
jgi:hypothetical protein